MWELWVWNCALPHKVCRDETHQRVLVFYQLLLYTSLMLLYVNSYPLLLFCQPHIIPTHTHTYFAQGIMWIHRKRINSSREREEERYVLLEVYNFPKFANSRAVKMLFIANTINIRRSALSHRQQSYIKATTIAASAKRTLNRIVRVRCVMCECVMCDEWVWLCVCVCVIIIAWIGTKINVDMLMLCPKHIACKTSISQTKAS